MSTRRCAALCEPVRTSPRRTRTGTPLGGDGISTQAGWFPMTFVKMASPEQLEALQQKMGGGEGAAGAVIG